MIFSKEQFVEQLEFVHSKSCRNNFGKFLFLLRISRLPFLKRNGLFLAFIQSGLINNVANLQDEATELSRERRTKTEVREIKRIDRLIQTRRQMLRILFSVMDGVVARCFYFNRPFLRIMSENKSSGYLTKNDQNHTVLLQSFLFRFRRGITLINDITRYLRVGDITRVFGDRKILIYEAKTNVKTGETRLIDVKSIFSEVKRNQTFPKAQFQRQIVAQMAMISKRISIPEDAKSLQDLYQERIGIDIIDLNFQIKTHISKLKRLFSRASTKMVASELLEEGYFVTVFRCDKLVENEAKEIFARHIKSVPRWVKSDSKYLFFISNYETFRQEDGEFARNTLPYSVFPFSARDCLRLMTGDLHVSISVDLTYLKRKLEIAGWDVKDGDFFDPQNKHNKFTRDNSSQFSYKDPVVFKISRLTEYGGYGSTVLATQILMGMLSFYSLDFFVDAVNSQFASSKPGDQHNVTHNYLNEEKIFL